MVKVTDTGRFDRAMRDLASKLGKSATLQVGFLDGATEADGTSVALIASIQEFGAPSRGIPPRPFMRTTIAEHSPTWGQQLTANMVATDLDVDRSLGMLGLEIGSQIQDTITKMSDPPLSPLTLMLRGMRSQAKFRDLPFGQLVTIARARLAAGQTNYSPSQKPLVDTGTLFNSVSSKVEDT